MTEILLCSQSMRADTIEKQCGIPISDIFGIDGGASASLDAYRPYLVGQDSSVHDQCLLHKLGSHNHLRNLMDLSLSVGPDNTLALASIHQQLHQAKVHERHDNPLHEYGLGMAEKTAAVTAHRSHQFVHTVKQYQDSLLAYRNAMKLSPGDKAAAKLKAKAAFDKMQQGFRNELRTLNQHASAHKGTPLNNFKRATNIAKSSRNVTKLNVAGLAEASKLGKLARYSKHLGKGLTALDFGMGVNTIRTSYQKGENWERTMFVESSGFVTTAVVGDIAVDGLCFLLAATPIGWVGLIVAGVVIAGAAVAGASYANKITHEEAGGYYDKIMKWVRN